MQPVLLVDFGSTYTKVTAVDVQSPALLGTAAAFTTVETDINEGLENALAILKRSLGEVEFKEMYACSSAAGGLKMISIGLVPELTVKAAKEATLGAGAKVMKSYAFQLTNSDIKEIQELRPDIILLTGGTDGGNSECILHNAGKLAEIEWDVPIVVAGNRSCVDECGEILKDRQAYLCENVMPALEQLNVLPAQKLIREIFLEKIVQGKGLTKAMDLMSGIVMPTPSAMLTAMELLAGGTGGAPGIGELVAVDLGGATTDVYSIAEGTPQNTRTVYKGLREPYAKRTVEGDIGMRYSIWGILEAAGLPRLSQLAGLPPEQVLESIKYFDAHKDAIADREELLKSEEALASAAVETAVTRHAGSIEQVYTPMGETWLQTGKDLRGVQNLIVTGGALVHSPQAGKIAGYGFYSSRNPESLRPEGGEILIDRNYILAAMGLLSGKYPGAALEIMKREIISYGD